MADADAKTITMDFIIDGGAYAIDPASIVWSAVRGVTRLMVQE